MTFRLWLIVITAVMLLGQSAQADTQLRYRARGNTPQEYCHGCGDHHRGGDRVAGSWHPPSAGYHQWGDSPFVGGWGQFGGYPIVPTPQIIAPPVVVPPLIARPVPPTPLVYRFIPGVGWVGEPAPNISRIYPQYPNVQTTGSAYFPTPTFPLIPRGRSHRDRDHRR